MNKRGMAALGIIIVFIIFAVLVIGGWLIYQSFKNSGEEIILDENIETFEIGQENAYIQLKKNSSNESVENVEIIFTSDDGNEYSYEINKTLDEDLLEGYNITAKDLGIQNFERITQIKILFRYREQETQQTQSTTGGGGGSSSTTSTSGGGGGGTSTTPNTQPPAEEPGNNETGGYIEGLNCSTDEECDDSNSLTIDFCYWVTGTCFNEDLANQVYGLVNDYRESLGLNRLYYNNYMGFEAQNFSDWLAENESYSSHDGATERFDRIRDELGVVSSTMSENVNTGSCANATAILNSWKASGGHNDSMKFPTYVYTGVGVSKWPSTSMCNYIQIFITNVEGIENCTTYNCV